MTEQQRHPPYLLKAAGIGGRPTIAVDVPICSVFLAMFVLGAIANMTILQLNQRKGHKFIISGLLFGFCMARILCLILRIVWACYPTDVETAIAAQIFVAAGVLILFLVNLVFAQRMIRAAHPIIGWHRAFHYTFAVLYGLIPGMLVMVITATVQSFYTLSATTHRIDRDMQLAAGSYLMFVSFLPIPMVVLCLLVRRKTRLEKFGTGRWRTKAAILLVSSALLCMGATFRIATSYKNPRPLDNPAWYHAKWCFYLFNFTVEIIVIYLFLAFRVDRRFHVPNKSKGPGDYAREYGVGEDEKQPEEPGRGSTVTRVVSNQERYDGQSQQDLEAGKPHETRV